MQSRLFPVLSSSFPGDRKWPAWREGGFSLVCIHTLEHNCSKAFFTPQRAIVSNSVFGEAASCRTRMRAWGPHIYLRVCVHTCTCAHILNVCIDTTVNEFRYIYKSSHFSRIFFIRCPFPYKPATNSRNLVSKLCTSQYITHDAGRVLSLNQESSKLWFHLCFNFTSSYSLLC